MSTPGDQLPPDFQLGDPSQLPDGFVPLPAPPQFKQEAPNLIERIGHGADRSIGGIHQAFLELRAALAGPDQQSQTAGKTKAQQELDDYTARLKDDERLYQQGRGKDAGIDWASLAGEAGTTSPLMLLPVGQATLAGRVGMGALQGSTASAIAPTESGSLIDRAKNTAIGAVTGGVVAPLANAATGKLVSALSSIPGRAAGAAATVTGDNTAARVLAEVPNIGSLPPEMQAPLIAEGRSQIGATGKLNATDLSRKANLLVNGLTPTASMVSRDPAQWSIERNLQKLAGNNDPVLLATGQHLTKVYQGNDQALAAKALQLSNPYGAATQEARGMTAMGNIGDLAKSSQKDVSTIYNAVRDTRGEELASDARNLHSVLGDLEDSPAADPVTIAVKRRLGKMGMLDENGNLTNKSMTVSQAEGLRQFVNQQPNVYGKSQVIKAIDNDVIGGLGDDAFQGPRAAAKARFDMLNNPATQKSLNSLGDLSQGKTAQGFIRTHIISAPEQDVNSLLATIGMMPTDAQNSTMNAIRGGVMEYLRDRAIKDNSQFSGAGLQGAMDVVGPNKLQSIFGDEVHGKLQSLVQAAKDATYEPPYASVNYSNTTPTLLNLMQKVRTLPFSELVIPEQAQHFAAQHGYAGQLAEALKAKASAPNVGLSPEVKKRLIRAMSVPAAPLAAAGITQLRQPESQ